MRKLFIGLGIGAALMVTGVSYASTLSFGSNSTTSVGSGSVSSFGVPAGSTFGYAGFVSQSGCGANTLRFSRVIKGGVTMYRTDLPWANIQSTSSASYVWGAYDCVVSDANAAGITMLFILDYAPQWAAHSGCTVGSSQCAPASATDFATYCAAAQTHYPNQKYWEIWNEPNLTQFWGPAANVAEYTASMIACSQAIKAVNPNAFILAGATSRGGNIAPPTFMSGIYSNGGQNYFDGLSMHPYFYPYSLTSGAGQNGWLDLATVRTTMVSNGDSAKPIWITEVGAPTCGPGKEVPLDVNPANYVFGSDYVSPVTQKIEISQIVTALKTQTYIPKVFIYTLIDQGPSGCAASTEAGYGLYFNSANAKPAWSVVESTP